MSAFLIYLLKSTLLIAVFDAFFLLVMRRSGHFRFNRIVLLAGSAVCLLLPFLRLHTALPTVYSIWLEPVVAGGSAQAAETAETAAAASANGIRWQTIFLSVYAAGALVTLLFYVRSYSGMFRLLRRTASHKRDGCTVHLLAQDTPPFSWMNQIVLSRSDFEHYPAIFAHEQAHVRFGHSHDLVLSSLLTVFQWFNPLVWICRSELKLLHEYEADDFVIKQGIDATQYQLLLVKKAVGEKRFLLANGFNHAQLKNRITMMQITNKAAWKKLSLLLLIPLLGGTLLLLAECKPAPKDEVTPDQPEKVTNPVYSVTVVDEPTVASDSGTDSDEVLTVSMSKVEVKPTFNDGNANSFVKWVNERLTYPDKAKEKQLEGRVTLQFSIEPDGSLTGAKVLRGVDPILDNEALKVVSQSPKWTPGYINGKPVRVTYVFPVIFQLK